MDADRTVRVDDPAARPEPIRLDRGTTRPGASAGTWRARIGTVSHYLLLVALATLVLGPVLLTFFQALSPTVAFLDAGAPWHPVSVEWKDRTWFTGGALSVTGRSVALVAGLAWLHSAAAGGGRAGWRSLTTRPRSVSVPLGAVAVALTSGPVIGALADRSPSTVTWFAGATVVVAVTQVPGFLRPARPGRPGRPGWRVALYAAATGLGITGVVVVAVGAAVWTDAWTDGQLDAALTRSLVMSVLIVVCQVTTSVLAAYAFAFLRFPLKGPVFAFVMATMLLPMEVTLLGNVQLIRSLGWVDSYQALVLPFSAAAFGTFLIRQGFRGIPPEIHDAARLDGYGHAAFLWRFAVPLTRPVIGAFTVVAGMMAWNQYLWPQAVTDDQSRETAQVALRTMTSVDLANLNVGIAGALVVSLPMLGLLIAFQKHIVRGLTAGAVK